MKRVFTIIMAVALVLAFSATALAAEAVQVPAVSVTASAEIEITPDIAYVSLGVRNEGKKAATVRTDNSKIMNKVISAVKAKGIAADDIATSNMRLSTKYTWDDNGNSTITGYTMNNTVTITVRDVAKVADVVDAAMEAGANVFNNVSFDVEDDEEAYVEVLQKATKKAMRRAGAMAAAAGKTLGTVLSITNSNASYSPSNYYYDMDMAEPEAAVSDGAANEAGSIGSTIQMGMITVRATVSASFALK